MPKIDLALAICYQEEDREKAVTPLLNCGLNPACCYAEIIRPAVISERS